MSGSLTWGGSNILLTKAGAQSIEKSGSGDFTIFSDGTTQIESVVFTDAAVSSVTTLTMSGDLDTTAGNILLTNTGNKELTHTGGGPGDLTVKSTDGDTKIENVVFDENTISMSGSLTWGGSNILLTKAGAQSIEKSGSGDFTIFSNGATTIESVVFTGAAVSSVTTLDMSGNIDTTGGNILLTNTGNKEITHTGGTSGDLTVKSTSGDTKIESVVFDGNAVSSVSTISMSGDLTNTGNDILLTKSGAQSIAKSGSGGFTVSSSVGTTTIENVVFTGNAVSSVSTLDLTGNIRFSANTDGIAATSANELISFNEKAGNNDCSGDTIDI